MKDDLVLWLAPSWAGAGARQSRLVQARSCRSYPAWDYRGAGVLSQVVLSPIDLSRGYLEEGELRVRCSSESN